MNITVYLGSSEGRNEGLKAEVQRLGRWIGENGHTLIYGGSKIGLMGILAESVITSGGKAIGIEPQFFIDAVVQYEKLTELIVTNDMAERKKLMIEMGEAFIAIPGGTGTLEEISEIMSMVSLGHTDAPCILFNYKGYYDYLKKQLERMIEEGFSTEERQQGICFADGLEEIFDIIEAEIDI